MDRKNSNITVSLTRCNDNMTFKKRRFTVNSKDTVDNDKSAEVKRSLRLSRKRTFQDESYSEINNQSNNIHKNKKKKKKTKCNKTKPEELTNSNGTKKSNYRVSAVSLPLIKTNLTNSDKLSNVQNSPSNVIDNTSKLPIKTTTKTLKNNTSAKKTSIERYESDTDDVFDDPEDRAELFERSRIRGRPLTRLSIEVNTRNNKVDKKTKNQAIIIEKLHDTNLSELSVTLSDSTTASESKSPEGIKKQRSGEKLSVCDEEPDESIIGTEAMGSLDTNSTPSEENSVSELQLCSISEDDDPPTSSRSLEREIRMLSKRFNIPFQTLRKIIANESLSVFREKYSTYVTSSMITVSPVVRMTDDEPVADNTRENETRDIKYKIEPIRESEAYEKTNLKDAIEELSNTKPSWSLSVVADPPRYVIAQMSIETNGTPVVNKSIVLDRYFRASVYVNQCLQYKYCKRYNTATEIINLIKELNDTL